MQMGMMEQVLPPAVEHSEKADLCAQMFGIGRDRGQGLGGGTKQNAVDQVFILVSDGRDWFRDREDDMEIMRLENLGHSFFDPLRTRERLALWTVAVAAAVVAGPLVIIAVAPLEMTAEGCGATHLDCGHDAP